MHFCVNQGGFYCTFNFARMQAKGCERKVGRKKEYTERTLRTAVNKYFASITRKVELTEKVDSGRKDKQGHVIYNTVPIMNSLGEIATVTEYLVPPTLGGLCRYLKIHASTWSRWEDTKKYPEFQEIIEDVMERMTTWRKEQVVLRKDVKGLIWDLETNYGCVKPDNKMPGDDKPHGVVLLPQINPLTPPVEDSHG